MFRKIAIASCALMSLVTTAWTQSATERAGNATPSASLAEPTNTMEQPLPGDHWTYELRDEITGTLKFTYTDVVTDVTPGEISIRMEYVGKIAGVSFFVFDRFWNLESSPTWKYSPNNGTGIRQPLKAGGTWTFQGNEIGGAGAFKRSLNAQVIGEETIKTRAGTFNAIRIEAWVSLHSINDPTKAADQFLTTWYEPSIDHWVKRIEKTKVNGLVVQNTAAELVAYGRRALPESERPRPSSSTQQL